MALSGTVPFDWLAVRTLGADKLELEFTEPLSASAEALTAYTVRHWGYTPQEAYGTGKGTTLTLAAKAVAVSADRKKAVLTVDGLKARNVVYIRLNGVLSQGGKAPWSTEAWYTLNNFGPADPPVALKPPRPEPAPEILGRRQGNRLLLQAAGDAAGLDLRVFDAGGKALPLVKVGERTWSMPSAPRRGLYWVKATRKGVAWTRRLSLL